MVNVGVVKGLIQDPVGDMVGLETEGNGNKEVTS